MSYSKEQIKKALELYQQCKSLSQTVRILGYPTRENLYKWIKKKMLPKRKEKSFQSSLTLAIILEILLLKLN